MSILSATAAPVSGGYLVLCVETNGEESTTSFWLNGELFCYTKGSFFGPRSSPWVFTFTHPWDDTKYGNGEEAFKVVTFSLFGESFPREKAVEYSESDSTIDIHRRRAIFKTEKAF